MSSTNLPKTVLKSPSCNESVDELTMQTLRSTTKFQEIVRTTGSQAMNEMHQNRIRSLRKELDYLKETEWKYESIDKYIGQTF